MSSFIRFYDRLVNAFAFLAGLMLIWLMVAVVLSVLIRNFGAQPPAWLFTSTEYSMFYLTLLGAPWLVREKGHVYIEVAISNLPPKILDAVSRLVMLICAVISFVLAWKGLELVISNIQGGDYDVRTYFVPMWILTVAYPISFALMGLEFTRFIFPKMLSIAFKAGNSNMAWHEALLFLLSAVLILMLIGAPVAFAFIGANIVGAWYFMGGEVGLTQLLSNGFGALSNFGLVPIPLFLLMGELFFRTGLGMRMFNAIDQLMGRVPGRLSYVTVVGGTAFSTLSGSSMGSTALLGSLLVPEMERRGYKKHMSIGPILGTGGLAIIIPPSAIAVLLATLAKLDIGDVLIAGIVPGLLLAIFYMVTIWIKTKIDPDAAPAYDVEPVSLTQKIKLFARDIMPMLSVIVIIVIMMLTGFATPSEAAAFGALGIIVLAALFKALTFEAFKLSVVGALRVTLMAYLIVFGSATFSQLLAFSGASSGLIQWAISFDLSPLLMLTAMFLVLLVLGTFMEAISIMMITVPFFFPLAQSLGFDLIWFSIVTLVALEVGFSTPPLGLNLFVMKGVAPPGTTMKEIYMASIPYILCSILLVIIMVIFPGMVTWLPYLS